MLDVKLISIRGTFINRLLNMGHSIISISVSDKLAAEIEKLKKELGFSGRSELVRAALKMLMADKREKENLKGLINCVLIVVHQEKNEMDVMRYKHVFDSIIKTHVHTNMKNNCMDLFTLEGDSKEVIGLTESLQKIKNIEYVKLIVS